MRPIARGMIHFTEVHQLVKNDVVPDRFGNLHEPPVQRDGSPSRTGAPARALIAHRYPKHNAAVRRRQFVNASGQLLHSQPSKMILNRPPQTGMASSSRTWQQDLLWTNPGVVTGFAASQLNWDTLAPEPNQGSLRPMLFAQLATAKLCQLFRKPATMGFGKTPRLRCVSTSRDGDAGPARAINEEPIPFGESVLPAQHWNLDAFQDQRGDGFRSRLRQPAEGESLHRFDGSKAAGAAQSFLSFWRSRRKDNTTCSTIRSTACPAVMGRASPRPEVFPSTKCTAWG